MTSLNVAVWGLGPHAVKNIVPALAQSPGLSLRGVCSRNADVVANIASTFGCARWLRPDEMLQDFAVDVIYLATPTGLHARQGRDVLEAGKHFWCEKPITRTEEEASSLVRESRVRGVTVAEGFMYLYHPQFSRLREALASGALGHVHTVTCRFGIPPLERPGFRMDPALGGSAFLDVGSYTVSAVVSLLPDEEPAVVAAEIATAPGSAVDTAGRAVLRYANDLSAVLDWRTGAAYRNGIDFWGTEGSLSSELVFSKSADYVPSLRFLDRHGVERRETGVAANHFIAMFAAFRGLIDDPAAAEMERVSIVRRAHLAARIKAHSQCSG